MTKKTITVKVPDTIPDPEFSILARRKGTLDEWEEVEYEEVGTCKWRKSISSKGYIVPSCCTCAIVDNDMMKLNYIYCPFCGRKIERV